MSTQESWGLEPAVGLAPDAFNHRLTVNEARRRLFGSAEVLRIGRYRVEGRLGAGGMGEVYLGIDEELDRKVAIKRVLPGMISERQHTRLRDEARALAKLSHENVVAVYEIGEHEQRTFVAMQYVEGQTLASWLAEQPRAWTAILERFCAAGRGLAAAHEAGVIHRDFKSDNVLLGVDGSVRVADFGLALASEDSSSVQGICSLADLRELDATNYIAGTFRYMSLEQLRGESIDARADQFSFCVALYEALWGEQPFALETVLERVEALEHEAPRRPARGKVPAKVWRILRRGMARSPAQRWPNMTSLLAALSSVPCCRRRQIEAWLAAPLLAGSMVAAAWSVHDRDDASPTSPEPTPVTAPAPASVEPPAVELASGPGRERPGTGARIWIAPNELRFAESSDAEHQHIFELEGGRIPKTARNGHTVVPLLEIMGRRPKTHDAITLFVDRRVPWTTIVDVLYSTGRAGYSRWDFAVETEGEVRVLPAKPAIASNPDIELARLTMLQLWITPDGVEVATRTARPLYEHPGSMRALDVNDGSCKLPRAERGRLGALNSKLCALNGVAIPVWVGAEPQLGWGEVVEILGGTLDKGICDGGIVMVSEARPKDCEAPPPADELGELLLQLPERE